MALDPAAFDVLASPLTTAYACLVYSRSAPRKFSTEQGLYNAALRALMRRAHSIHQMREYLELRAEEKEHATQVIARLREQNYLDDARYALEFARSHANSRRQGRFRIARELRTRGVPDRYIESALDAVFDETDEAALIRTRLQHLLSRNRKPLDRRKLASIYGSLLRSGFSGDAIRSELRHVSRDEPAAPSESMPE